MSCTFAVSRMRKQSRDECLYNDYGLISTTKRKQIANFRPLLADHYGLLYCLYIRYTNTNTYTNNTSILLSRLKRQDNYKTSSTFKAKIKTLIFKAKATTKTLNIFSWPRRICMGGQNRQNSNFSNQLIFS